VIKKAETAMNAEKQDTSRETVKRDEMEVEMEMGAERQMEVEMEAEVDTTATAMEPVPVSETVDPMVNAMEVVLEMEVEADSM
jgi:hypothetical protein